MGAIMERYKNLNGDSGVATYEIGQDFIRVEFKTGAIYLYTNARTTPKKLATPWR